MNTHILNLKKRFLLPAVLAGLTAVTVISCQKSSSETSATADLNEQKLNVTNAVVASTSNADENFDMIMGKGEFSEDPADKSSCKVITYSPSKDVFPHTKTIDFGAGCTVNGVTKSGKVVITYYDPETEFAGKYTVTTYDNYYVDGIHVEGTIQVNKIRNISGQTVYIHSIHKTLSTAAGDVKDFITVAEWTVINWQGGTDNAYSITERTAGSEKLNGIESYYFQANIDSTNHNNAVIKPFSCNKRVQGVLNAKIHFTHVVDGTLIDLDEYLDYGNGECDNLGTLSVNGGTPEQVTLPLRFWPLKF